MTPRRWCSFTFFFFLLVHFHVASPEDVTGCRSVKRNAQAEKFQVCRRGSRLEAAGQEATLVPEPLNRYAYFSIRVYGQGANKL